ncbi:NUDIX domain-containing protein (plasmid) [Deinococcus taeanensis]|uniref:NUDIX hydrolase n=1 Tax=Deinococcus taeanensis TaxID=2737050 RepID=UPI001CDCF5B7|nr:NUDIX domain-containing protein [Deinococcus taeanensis]UBV44592.1 NUDIX domain-containing protein [Deinococcus taeanensis]
MTSRHRYRVSSTVFVVLRSHHEFCSLKRVNTGWMDGFYSLPAGGVEEGETLLEAARREALEEVGVLLNLEDLRLVHTLHSQTQGDGWLDHFFVADRWEGTPRICELDRHEDLCWLSFDAIPEQFVPYVRSALVALTKGETYSIYGWPHAETPELATEHLKHATPSSLKGQGGLSLQGADSNQDD